MAQNNPFDQFDEEPETQSVNPFDQFDSPAETQPVEEVDNIFSAGYKSLQNIPEKLQKIAGGAMSAIADRKVREEQEVSGLRMRKEQGEDLGFFENMRIDNDDWRKDVISRKDYDPLEKPDILTDDLREEMKAKGRELFKEGSEAEQKNQPKGLNVVEKWGYDVFNGMVDMIPTLAASYLLRSPVMGASTMAGQVGSITYGEGLELGLTEEKAANRAVFYSIAEGLPETLVLSKFLQFGSPTFKKVIDTTIGEGATESITSILQQTYDNKEIEGMTLQDAMENIDWNDVAYSGSIGMGMGSAMGGISYGVGKLKGDEKQAESPDGFEPTHKASGGVDVQPLFVNGNRVADTYTDKNKNIIRDPAAVEIVQPTDTVIPPTPVAPKYDINSFDVDAQSAAIKAEVEAGAAAGDARQGIINSVFGAPAEIIPDPVDLSAQQAEINQQIINDAATGTTLPENPQAIETGKRPENIQDQIASIEAEADKAGITDPIEKRQFVIEQLYGESPKPKVKTQAELNEEKIQAAKTGTTRPKTTPKDLSLRYKKADRKQAISLQEQAVDSGLTDISEINQYVIDNATGSVKTQAEKNQIRLNSMATGTIKIADNQTAQYSREQMRKRLPENLQDPRLGREIYRDSLNSLLTDLTPGGGIAVVPDPDYVRGEGDGGAIPMKRTPSLNPDWAQAIMAEESAEMKDLENAVKKALEGKKLGVRQARIVTAMLDQVTGERTDPAVINYVTNARAEAQAARREALGNDSGAEIAGEVYEETEYEMEWSGDNRAFYELYNESVEIDQAQAENIFDENYKTDADLPVIAKLLSERIISNERTIDEKADTQRPEDRAKAEEAEVEKDLVAEARSGDKAAQSKLKEYGLGWDGDKTKYRFINDREVDILLSGKKVNSIRDNNRTDITSTGEESNKGTGDQSSGPDGNNVYRVTFKKTDRFDTDRTGADAILKSESLGDYHLSNGYSIDDVQLVERQNDDGKFEQIYSDAGSKTAEEIASAASEAEGDTATDPQIEADNYKKGRIQNLQGFKIVIENEAGTKRRPEWPPLAHNYGDIAETLGADGDKIDAFVKKGVDIPADNPIYVINQNDQGTSSFDEHKTMFGFSSVDDAKKGYLDSYTADFDGFGSIVEATPEQLKQWIEKGDTTKAYPVDVKAPRGSSTKRDEVSDPTYSNFNGNIIEYEIEIGETGETYTVSADAGQLMRDTDKRIESMEKLMDCVK